MTTVQRYAATADEILSAVRQILNQDHIDATDRYRATTAVQVAAVYAQLAAATQTGARPGSIPLPDRTDGLEMPPGRPFA